MKKYIDDQAEILGVQSPRTVLSHFITATLEICSCMEFGQFGFTNSTSPISIVNSLIPFLCKINDDSLQMKLASYEQTKCKNAQKACAADLLQHSLKICTNNPLLDFNGEKALILPNFFKSQDFELQIDENKLNFISAQHLLFDSQEIKTFSLNFATNLKLIPAIEINENHFLLSAP